jgi:prepilin-type N-terminal cleavage/methylation domain-containing protein
MNKTRTCAKPPCAFTLLELLLVLVLIAISVAAIVPRFHATLGAWQLRETAWNLQAALRWGSQWAYARQEPVTFVLNVQRGVFSLTLSPDEPSADRALLPMGWQPLGQGVSVARAEGLKDVGQEKVLVFRSDGTSEPAVIVLTNGGAGSTWQIDLDGRGTVHCQEKLGAVKESLVTTPGTIRLAMGEGRTIPER